MVIDFLSTQFIALEHNTFHGNVPSSCSVNINKSHSVKSVQIPSFF